MAETINRLFDSFRKWKYIETKYDPRKCFAYDFPLSQERPQYEQLEKMYEWNYANLRGEWSHTSKNVKKGRLCRTREKHFFIFKRKEDAVAFKLQWGE